MGWLWSSTSAPAPPHPAQDSSATSAPFPPDTTAFPDPSPQKPLSRDEIAEKELHSFLAELSADAKPSSTKYNRVRKGPSTPTSSNSNSSPSNDPNLPLSEQLLPTY